MRASAQRWGSQLVLALEAVAPELEAAVRELAFEPERHRYVRRFPADAPHADRAAARFPLVAAGIVSQTARLSAVPWEDALAELIDRAAGVDWWLTGSAALAVRGLDVAPRDLDVIVDGGGAPSLADALADLLVEPLVPGGALGEWWTRAFVGARVEIVGNVRAAVDDPEPSDFGPVAAGRLDVVRWRDADVRVPPLELQLAVSRRRGLDDRVRAIRAALQ
jgi:hypothetical protein